MTLTKWRTTWQDRFPRVPLEVFEATEADQRRVLDDGAVDLCFVRLPLARDGLHLITLYDEVPVAWIAKDHPLAALDSLSTADLADEDVFDTIDSHTIDLVVLAGAVLRVPMSIARTHSRRDLVYRPLTDAPSSTVALAWLVDNPHEWIDEFIGVVRGRTVNSSRSVQDRGTAQPSAKVRKPPPKPQRGQRRRRR